jgi:sugar lactone lactonase YvrE
MVDSRFRQVIAGFSFLESPRWHDGRLWLSDFYTHRVLAVDAAGKVETVLEVPQQPSGMGWLPDGRLLVASMRDRRVLRLEPDGRLVTHADLSGIATGHVNDMVVDALGRAYVGNFGFDLMAAAAPALARLACISPDGQASVAAEDLYFPNGSMITPDGKTLIVCETMGNRISAFDIIGPDGKLGPRRDWARFGPPPTARDFEGVSAQLVFTPDGAVLDAEGAVWCAQAFSNKVMRVAEGGRVLQEISTGEMGAFACTLGGPDQRTLYICVAPDSMEHNRASKREAEIWSIQVDVPGAGRP